MAECVFHSDRYVFETLVRDIRKADFTTRAHANVMAMAVCSCRKRDTHRRPISTQEVLDAANHVIGSFMSDGITDADAGSNLVKHLSPLASKMVLYAAHASQWTTDRDLEITNSDNRLTVIISQILRQRLDPTADDTDSSLLREEREAAEASMKACGRGGNGAGKATPRPGGKLSPDIIRKIVRKKKNRSPVVESFTLPLFGGSTWQLLNNDLVGPGFSRLGRKHGCVLEIDSEATASCMAKNVATTIVKAWCPSHKALNSVMNTLVKLSCEIQERNDQAHEIRAIHRRMVRQCWDYERQYWDYERTDKIIVASNNTAADNPTEYKDCLSFDFGTKVLHKPKYRAPQAKCKTPILAEGHCLNCLLPFNDYKPRDSDVIKAVECRHHPGFVNSIMQWTCCQAKCESKKPSNEEHVQDGCATSNHCWRPHKKASRGVGEKAYRHERSFRKRRLTLAPHTMRPLVY